MEIAERKEAYVAGLQLLGNWVRFRDSYLGIGRRCVNLCPDGMVELEGISGRFSPYALEIDSRKPSAPLGLVN